MASCGSISDSTDVGLLAGVLCPSFCLEPGSACEPEGCGTRLAVSAGGWAGPSALPGPSVSAVAAASTGGWSAASPAVPAPAGDSPSTALPVPVELSTSAASTALSAAAGSSGAGLVSGADSAPRSWDDSTSVAVAEEASSADVAVGSMAVSCRVFSVTCAPS